MVTAMNTEGLTFIEGEIAKSRAALDALGNAQYTRVLANIAMSVLRG